MFETDFLNRPTPPAVLLAPAEKSYRLLWRLVAEAYPDADETEVKVRTIIMTSTGHGFLTLSSMASIHNDIQMDLAVTAMQKPLEGAKRRER